MDDEGHSFFLNLEDAFNDAMISNDRDRISACVSQDWVLVTPEAGPVDGERILSAIEAGVLVHHTMTKQNLRTRIYGDVAVVIGRGQNTGLFKGEPISADEWITDVYYKVAGQWRCVLTHLTPAPELVREPADA
ncbi:MAG: nuclear transport factor 2 family protein [Terricaulis sp.]